MIPSEKDTFFGIVHNQRKIYCGKIDKINFVIFTSQRLLLLLLLLLLLKEEFMYRDTMNVEPEIYDYTGNN